jgi:hypothetical protein
MNTARKGRPPGSHLGENDEVVINLKVPNAVRRQIRMIAIAENVTVSALIHREMQKLINERF